ncbi:hypothetical protein ACJRO7_010090 [Eucalyptus globulus]|uniref:DNAJC9 HTH domain-containing protein n=1 Tax=Eucalyptus globulus TaxID=34317 RepID=A0ABD3LAZ1_EUCGL
MKVLIFLNSYGYLSPLAPHHFILGWSFYRLARDERNASAFDPNELSYFDRECRSLYRHYDDLAGEVAQNLHEYFRAVYKFEANFRGSDYEKNDLIDLYEKFKGNMNRLFCSMLCSDPKLDSHRFKDIIDEAIAAGTLKTTKAYEKWAKQISKTEPLTDPLRKRGKAKKKSDDLLAIISQRRSERKEHFDSMFSSLVNKYGGGMQSSEPSEEEFEAARKKLESRKSAKKSRQK